MMENSHYLMELHGGIRLIQSNSDEQLHQQQFQQQGIIMSGNDQCQQEQVFSPLKQNDQAQHTQYITQDESMPNHYVIQSSPQQFIYATNISPQRSMQQQQQQQIAMNHNIIAQQNQNQQKVRKFIYFE